MTAAAKSPTRTSLDVLASGELTINVPDVTAYPRGPPEAGDSVAHAEVAKLPLRNPVFYDENLPVYVHLQLRGPEITSAVFNADLQRLVIAVDAAAVSLTNSRYSSLGLQMGQKGAPDFQETSFPIFSAVLDHSSMVYKSEPVGAEDQTWAALWYFTIPIHRPRVRLSSPRIAISARANLRDGSLVALPASDSNEQAEYLTQLAPLQTVNLLDGLSQDVLFADNPPTLLASKVLPQVPSISVSGPGSSTESGLIPEIIRLKKLNAKIYIPVFPCISLRLRCSRLPSSATLSEDDFNILASLDVDIVPFAKTDVVLQNVDLSVVGGKTEHLVGQDESRFPMPLRPLDGVSEIFELYPLSVESNSGSNRNSGVALGISGDLGMLDRQSSMAMPKNLTRAVSVTVDYMPVLRRGANNETFGPQITTVWNTTVDFSATGSGAAAAAAQNPPAQQAQQQQDPAASANQLKVVQPTGFRAVSGRSSSAWLLMQQQQLRSPSGSLTLSAESPLLSSSQHWGSSHAQPPPTPSAVREIVHEGLSLTISGPTEVLAGQVFSWKVFITNRSRTPKRISLIVQPKKWKMNNLKVLPRSPQLDKARLGTGQASIVMDETALLNAHQAGMIESDELISLVNDIRIGPLAPGANHETELKLIALGTGVLTLDGVRVVDLVKGEGFDCTSLMKVICRRE